MRSMCKNPIASALRMTAIAASKPQTPIEAMRRAVAASGVDAIERKLLEAPQAPCPVVHRFGPGVYIREVLLPAGAVAIGHRQKFAQMNVMLTGRVTIFNEDGTTSNLVAPMIFTGEPGRKVGYVHEDCVWLNIYATDEKDIETLEATYLDKSEAFVESKNRLIGLPSPDDGDFIAALNEIGVSRDVVRAQSDDESDMTELPCGGYKVKVASSLIEGKGLFATADISPGETVAPMRIGGKRTIAGRYANHSKTPNAKAVKRAGGDIDLVAASAIGGCRGGFDGEEITVDYRQVIAENKKEFALCQE